MTGETQEVCSDKRKPRKDRIIDILDIVDIIDILDIVENYIYWQKCSKSQEFARYAYNSTP